MHDVLFDVSRQQDRVWTLMSTRRANDFRTRGRRLVTEPISARTLAATITRVLSDCQALCLQPAAAGGLTRVLRWRHAAPCIEIDVMHVDANDDARDSAMEPWTRGSRIDDTSDPFTIRAAILEGRRPTVALDLPSVLCDARGCEILLDAIAAATDVRAASDTEYLDYVDWQREILTSSDASTGVERWRRHGITLPARYGLAIERHAPDASSVRLDGWRIPIDQACVTRIRELARRLAVAPRAVLCTAWSLLLQRLLGGAAFTLGFDVDGRRFPEIASVIGLFARRVPLDVEIVETMTVGELIADTDRRMTDAEDWQEYFSWTAIAPRAASLPFAFECRTVTRSIEPAAWEPARCVIEPSRLALTCVDDGRAIDVVLLANRDEVMRSGAPHMTRQYTALLRALLDTPECLAGELPLRESPEHVLRVSTGRADGAAPARTPSGAVREPELSVVDRFSTAAWRTPSRIAVVDARHSLMFAELDRWSDAMADALRHEGIGVEHRVALLWPRGVEWVVAMLGVLKSGAAYVPIEIDLPQERLDFVLEDAGVSVVLADAAMQPRLNGRRLVSLPAMPPSGAPSAHRRPIRPEQLAYVIYTSGSTGRPKGVGIEHRQLAHYMSAIEGAIGLSDVRSCGLVSSPASDLGHTVLFPSLCLGLTLHIFDDDVVRDAPRLMAGLHEARIDAIKMTPSHFFAVLPGAHAGQTHPSLVILGGEASTWSAIRAAQEQWPHARFVNHYGPTEGTVGATTHRLHAVSEGVTARVPIGRPLARVRTYVVGGDRALAPLGVAGELYLGGAGVARGYLGRPGLTATRFVPDAFSGEPGARLYRTGDRMRWTAAGALEYLGRFDHQIKLRGHRIELGEIEAALTALDDVRQSVVVLREDVSGTPQLVAYVVRDPDAPARDAEAAGVDASGGVTSESWTERVRARLATRLPAFMVPAVIVPLAALPLTPNGKVDRRALPAPPTASHAAALVAPTTPREAQLAAIWARVLKQPAVSIDANFFALGGDSILSIQVVARAAQAGLRLTPRQVFEHPTVRRLAAVAEALETAATDRAGASFALTPIQAAFVMTPRVARDYYNQAVLLAVAPGVAGRSVRRALHALEAQHGLLRARFVQDAAGWRGAIAPAVVAPMSARVGGPAGSVLPGVSPSHVPAARTSGDALCVVALERVSSAAVGRVQARVCAQWQRSLCLATGPVWRAGLVTRADGERRLLLVAHHLIVDGVSWRILLEDLQQALAQIERGLSVTLPPASSSFAQWSTAVQTAAARWPVAAEQAWWRATAAAPVAPLPCDASAAASAGRARRATDPPDVDDPSAASTVDARRAANRAGTVRTVTVSLSAAATTRLVRRTAQATGSGTEAVLLTAVAGAVGRWSGTPTVRVALEGHGREELPGVDVSRTVGWFTTIYPVTLPAAGAPAARLHAVMEQLAAVPRRGFGYGLLRTHLADPAVRAERLADVAPEISVNYLGQFDAVWDDAALLQHASESTGPAQRADEARPYPIEVVAAVHDGCLRLRWMYSATLHTRATIDALAQDCLRQLESLLAPHVPDMPDDVRGHAAAELAAADELTAAFAELGIALD